MRERRFKVGRNLQASARQIEMKKRGQIRAEAEVVQDVQAALLKAAEALEQTASRLKPLREEMRALPSVQAVEREMESPDFDNNSSTWPPTYRLYADVVDVVDLSYGGQKRGLRALAAELRRNAKRAVAPKVVA